MVVGRLGGVKVVWVSFFAHRCRPMDVEEMKFLRWVIGSTVLGIIQLG
jgi:hypothetical protein